jgi:hypothetical protein
MVVRVVVAALDDTGRRLPVPRTNRMLHKECENVARRIEFKTQNAKPREVTHLGNKVKKRLTI